MRISIAAPSRSAREQIAAVRFLLLRPVGVICRARFDRVPIHLLVATALVMLPLALRPAPAAGDSLFGPPIPHEVAPHDSARLGETPPQGIAIGDLNGDGKPDLVIPNYTLASNISVLLGNGDGTFAPRTDYPAGLGNVPVAIADVDGDGRLDVVSGDEDGRVLVLLGHGDGTLASKTDFLVASGSSVKHVEVGDLNGDGKPDIAVATLGPLYVLLGNGDGTFTKGGEYVSGGGAVGVAIGDLNRDGKPDLVTPFFAGGLPASGTVAVLIGNGDGTFQEAQRYEVGGGLGPQSVSIVDLNGDGNPDLLVGGFGDVSVLIGNGSGSFVPSAVYPAHHGEGPWPLQGQGVGVGDLNGDGRPDIAVADEWHPTRGAPGLLVLLGNGDGTFREDAVYGGNSSYAVAIGDLNGDGRPDLVAGGEVMLNLGSQPVRVDLEIHPGEVSLDSDRQWITATLETSRPYQTSQIDLSSIRLNGRVRPSGQPSRDGRREMTMRFAWADVKETLDPGRRVAVTLSGAIAGTSFQGTDWIEVHPSDSDDDVPQAIPASASPASVARMEFALRPENPGQGRLSVRFSLPVAGAATLDVFDVSGRRTAAREVGASGPGWHALSLGDAAPGLYVVRLRQQGRSLTSRVAVIR